ncbi:MAG: carbohydrate ABC transporter permease [Bacteroidota bacterium]|nr:carbohydrate ABC transporter permease [Bacteroidota bacterium]MDP4195436.1 carbohydrate ABC transporter permease [Bacteroidota bacterium]
MTSVQRKPIDNNSLPTEKIDRVTAFNKKKRSNGRTILNKLFIYTCLTIGAVLFIYPFVWMLSASLAPEKQMSSLVLFPETISFNSYAQVVDKIPIIRSLINSLFVSLSVTFGVIVFGSMIAYALTNLEFKGKNLIFYIIIFTMTLPFQITLIPQYILMVKFSWVDSYLALIVPYLINGLSIIIFQQYFKTIPKDMIDAARIDGCNEFRILFRILWPNSVPAIVTVGIMTFMGVWNEVLWPIIVIRNENLMTMPQLVTLFAVGGRAESQLGVKLAAATMLALPIVIAYAFFQRYFIQSMASSGLKE